MDYSQHTPPIARVAYTGDPPATCFSRSKDYRDTRLISKE